jgi:hypothetical protein
VRPESREEDDEDHPLFDEPDEPDELDVEELEEEDPWEPTSWAVRPVSLLSLGGVRVWAISIGPEGSSLGVVSGALGSLDTVGSLGAAGSLGSLAVLGGLGSLAGSKVLKTASLAVGPKSLLSDGREPSWPANTGRLASNRAAAARGSTLRGSRSTAGLWVVMGALLFHLRTQLRPGAVKTKYVVVPKYIFP